MNYIKYRKLMHFSLFVRFFLVASPKKKNNIFSLDFIEQTQTRTQTHAIEAAHITPAAISMNAHRPASIRTVEHRQRKPTLFVSILSFVSFTLHPSFNTIVCLLSVRHFTLHTNCQGIYMFFFLLAQRI